MRHTPGSVAAPAASCKTCRRASFILWPRRALESRALREQRPASTRSIENADGLRLYRREVRLVLQRNLACRAEDNWSYDKWSYDVRGRGSAVIGYGRGRSAFCGPRGVRCGSILLKKSFGGGERNFLGLLMRFMRGDVRDHVASQQNDHGASYRRCKAWQWWSRSKIKFSEIFDVVRFSTFSTVSVISCPDAVVPGCPLLLNSGHWLRVYGFTR